LTKQEVEKKKVANGSDEGRRCLQRKGRRPTLLCATGVRETPTKEKENNTSYMGRGGKRTQKNNLRQLIKEPTKKNLFENRVENASGGGEKERAWK